MMEQTIETPLTDRQIFVRCREQLHRFCPDLSPGLLNALSLGWRIVRFKKRELLLKAGVVPDEAHLVIEGLVRAYYPTAIEDITVNFVAEGEFATHYTSLESPRPSHFSFEALEDTIVVAFSYEYLGKLRTAHAELERLVRFLIEHEYARLLAHTESLLIRNGEERYRLFLKNFGALMPRISVADLSSYLGLSRQNVTLIRKRLLQG